MKFYEFNIVSSFPTTLHLTLRVCFLSVVAPASMQRKRAAARAGKEKLQSRFEPQGPLAVGEDLANFRSREERMPSSRASGKNWQVRADAGRT